MNKQLITSQTPAQIRERLYTANRPNQLRKAIVKNNVGKILVQPFSRWMLEEKGCKPHNEYMRFVSGLFQDNKDNEKTIVIYESAIAAASVPKVLENFAPERSMVSMMGFVNERSSQVYELAKGTSAIIVIGPTNGGAVARALTSLSNILTTFGLENIQITMNQRIVELAREMDKLVHDSK